MLLEGEESTTSVVAIIKAKYRKGKEEEDHEECCYQISNIVKMFREKNNNHGNVD